MDKILGVIGTVPGLFGRHDDDFADRLSHCHSTALLIVFAIAVSTKQFVGEPINCWVPAHFTSNHEEYANSYCWIRNTYYLPYDQRVPMDNNDNNRRMIPYYQWVPLALLIQALLFYMPYLVWRTLSGQSGIYIGNLVECGQTLAELDMTHSRDQMLQYMTRQMDRFLCSQRPDRNEVTECTVSFKNCLARTCFACCGRRRGNYLLSLYLLVKVLFLINAIGQLFALNLFLGYDFHLYGIEVIRSLIYGVPGYGNWKTGSGIDWTTSPRFPRVTMCDFRVRRLGANQRYTVQCVLPINLFNEKLYLFLWFWMAFVAAATAVSLLVWSTRAALFIDRMRYIKKHLVLMNKLFVPPNNDSTAAGGSGSEAVRKRSGSGPSTSASTAGSSRDAERKQLKRFVSDYLRHDGAFVLRLVGHNTDAITVTEMVCALWDNYRGKHLVGAAGEEPGDDDTDSGKYNNAPEV